MKKAIIDFTIVENRKIHALYSLLRLTPADRSPLPEAMPGQFVQVAVPESHTTFLRRPISINKIDREANELWLLVRKAGAATEVLCDMEAGKTLNIIMPLGSRFSLPAEKTDKILLIGGGVGIAPMLYFGIELKALGYNPEFLIGARSEADLLELDMLREIAEVHVSTDDGSAGERGVVTTNSVLTRHFDKIYCCGPAPMMKAVAAVARKINADCEVSLENMMACGLGACLCCVEQTVKGNVCVCTEGPVFNINQLTW